MEIQLPYCSSSLVFKCLLARNLFFNMWCGIGFIFVSSKVVDDMSFINLRLLISLYFLCNPLGFITMSVYMV